MINMEPALAVVDRLHYALSTLLEVRDSTTLTESQRIRLSELIVKLNVVADEIERQYAYVPPGLY